MRFRPDFTSKFVHVLAFGTPTFYIAPYKKIKHGLVNLSSKCDVKLGLRVQKGETKVLKITSVLKHDKTSTTKIIYFMTPYGHLRFN